MNPVPILGLPWELHVATLLEGLIPVLAWAYASRRGFELSRQRKFVIAWLLVFFTNDIIGLVMLRTGMNNQWLKYIFNPIADVLILLALSDWQDHPLRRIGIRVAMFILIPVWVGYAIAEGVGTFGKFSDPLRSTVILLAALVTLVGNSLSTSRRIVRQDWFWVASGVALYFALEVALGPFVDYIFPNSRDFALRAFLFKARIDILAFVLIAVGFLCPPEVARRSGIST